MFLFGLELIIKKSLFVLSLEGVKIKTGGEEEGRRGVRKGGKSGQKSQRRGRKFKEQVELTHHLVHYVPSSSPRFPSFLPFPPCLV